MKNIRFKELTNYDKVIARVHLIHPMNGEQRQDAANAAADSQTKSTDLGCIRL